MYLFDMFDMIFTHGLSCGLEELDQFAENATDEEHERLAKEVMSTDINADGENVPVSTEVREWFLSVVNRRSNEKTESNNQV